MAEGPGSERTPQTQAAGRFWLASPAAATVLAVLVLLR
jgi:hypothetical protein